jgi:plastocyanin
MPSGATVVAIEQRASVDPATDNIKPGDRVTVSWDSHAPLLLGIVNDDQVPQSSATSTEETR